MNADALLAAVNAFGPLVAVVMVLIWVLLKNPTNSSSSPNEEFTAEQKLYIREHILDPILKAINQLNA